MNSRKNSRRAQPSATYTRAAELLLNHPRRYGNDWREALSDAEYESCAGVLTCRAFAMKADFHEAFRDPGRDDTLVYDIAGEFTRQEGALALLFLAEIAKDSERAVPGFSAV